MPNPIKRRWVNRVVTIVLVVSVFVAFGTLANLGKNVARMVQARKMLLALGKTGRAVATNETAVSRYLLSNGDDDEQAFREAENGLRKRIAELAAAANEDTAQSVRVASLSHLLAERTENFGEIQAVRARGGAVSSLRARLTGRERRLADETARLLDEMSDHEIRQLEEAAVNFRNASNSSFLTFALTTILVLALVRTVAVMSRREIESRERAETVLRQNEQWLTATLSGISDAVIATDERGVVRLINPNAQALTGWGAREAKGRRLDEILRLLDEESGLSISNPVERVLRDGQEVPLSNHTILVARDGTERQIENVGAPIRAADGVVSGVVLCFRDVTERARNERELEASKELAEAANRAKDQFLAVLSHELRTPLTPVLVAVSGLLDEGPPADLKPTLEMIQRNIVLESRMIDDLLDLSRIEHGHFRIELDRVDVHEIILRALETCRNEIERADLTVRLELDAADHYTRGDAGRLMQVFWNLAGNAAKFAPGGHLHIRTGNDPQTTGLAHDRRLMIEFSDDGIGIEPELMPRIFSPFEQGRRSGRRQGLGLGLAIGQRVVDAHGGRIHAESPGLGRGATLRVELAGLPAPSRSLPPIEAAEPSPGRASSGLEILLVEDNRDTLHYLALVLGKKGHRVRTASTLDEAKRALDGPRIELLISDIELPDGSGLDLMRRLRGLGDVPGIAVSGFGTDEDVKLSLDAGFSTHLCKPVTASQLEETIQRLKSNRQGLLSAPCRTTPAPKL
jgi:PAS domain S-box-containing protein